MSEPTTNIELTRRYVGAMTGEYAHLSLLAEQAQAWGLTPRLVTIHGLPEPPSAVWKPGYSRDSLIESIYLAIAHNALGQFNAPETPENKAHVYKSHYTCLIETRSGFTSAPTFRSWDSDPAEFDLASSYIVHTECTTLEQGLTFLMAWQKAITENLERISRSTNPTFPTQPTPTPLINNTWVRTLTQLTSESRNIELITIKPAEGIAVYQRKNSPYGAILDCNHMMPSTWHDGDESAAREQILTTTVEKFAQLGRDEALVALYILGRLIASPDGVARIGFPELINLEGLSKHATRDQKEARARRYELVFLQWSMYKPFGKIEWTDTITGKRKIYQEPSPLFIYQTPFYHDGQSPLTGMYNVPAGYTFVDATVTKQFRNDPKFCHQIGQITEIAKIPSGKLGGDWAKSIAFALVQQARNNAHNGGKTVLIKRSTLLRHHPPTRSPESILSSADPKHARLAWYEAITMLKDKGFIESIDQREDNLWPRQGWQSDWFQETLTITLAGPSAEQLDKIRTASTVRVLASKRKRSKPKG